MVYENLFYLNISGEWVVKTFIAGEVQKAADLSSGWVRGLSIKTYYIYCHADVQEMWLYQPPFATNPTYWNTEDVPAEVRALNLIHQP